MKRTIKLSLCLLSALLTLLSCQEESIQADYQIIPLPQQIQLKSNEDPFIINKKTNILYPKGNKKLKEYAQLLAQYIEEKTHKEITIDSGTKANNSIILQIVPQSTNLEGYQIDINSHQITISGITVRDSVL